MFFGRWTAAIMAGIMMISLQGPVNLKTKDSAEEMMKTAIRKLEQADSVHANLNMDMEIKVFGFTFGAEAAMDMITVQSPLQLMTEAKVDLGLLGETETANYACEKDGDYLLYTQGKKGWTVKEVEEADLYKFNGKYLMQTWLEQITDLEEQGKDTLQGRSMYKYSGVVKKEGLQKILLDTGSIEQLADVLKGSVLKPLGSLLDQEEKVRNLMGKAEDLPVTVWIDEKTGYAVQCTMDVTEMLSDAFGKLMGKENGKSTRRDIWSKVELEKVEIVIQAGEFNGVQELPESVGSGGL